MKSSPEAKRPSGKDRGTHDEVSCVPFFRQFSGNVC